MRDVENGGQQQPARAAFLGARRAEHYFEDWPTSVTGPSRPTRSNPRSRAVITAVPQKEDTWVVQRELADESAGAPTSEDLLQQMTQDARPSGAANPRPTDGVAPAQRAISAPQRAERSGWLGLGRRGPSRAQIAAQELDAARTAIRLASWTRSMGVLVANPKGGVGKTPSALILGGVFANVRGGQSVVYEVTDDAGSLAVRAEGPMTAGVAELARDAGEIRGAGQLASYTTQQTSYAAVIGAPRDRNPLGYEDVQRVSDILGFFYPVRVMDSGNQLSSGAMYGAFARADVLVIPVLEAIDSVSSAAQLTRYLRRLGGAAAQLAEGAIVLRIDDGRPVSAEVRSYVDDALASAGLRDVYRIPYDPHIAERSTITLGKLRPATVEAYTYAAAAVTHRLNSLIN